MRNSLKLFITFVFLLSIIKPALSKDDPSMFQAAEIREAYVTPSDVGGTSILRFHIRNNSPDTLVILGVEGLDHEHSKIIVQLGSEKYSELGSIPLLAEEHLDMTSSHMFVQLLNVGRPIKSNEKIKLRIILTKGQLPFTAHVRALVKR